MPSAAAVELTRVASALGGLKCDARLAIYRHLVQAGGRGLTPGELSETLGIMPSTLSFHMKELCRCNLLMSMQEGRSIFYSVNPQTMAFVIGYLQDNCC